MKSFFKGLIVAAITLTASVIATNGMPHGLIGWELFLFTLLGSMATYVVQSWAIPTTSILGRLNQRDFVKGAIMVVGNALSMIGAQAATTHVDLMEVLKSVGSLLLMYAVKQLATPPTKFVV